MSRIGVRPVAIPKTAKVKVENKSVMIEGPKGKLSVALPECLEVAVEETRLLVTRKNDLKTSKAAHGLIRNLIKNNVTGVTVGYVKKLDITGVGFKAILKGKVLNMALGYSHEINFAIPAGVTITVPQQTSVIVEGIDKVLVGQVAANIRDFYKPEPYKGKGVRYADEQIRRKQGKVVG